MALSHISVGTLALLVSNYFSEFIAVDFCDL